MNRYHRGHTLTGKASSGRRKQLAHDSSRKEFNHFRHATKAATATATQQNHRTTPKEHRTRKQNEGNTTDKTQCILTTSTTVESGAVGL